MKIALTGAQCTGKTTLMSALKEIPRFKEYKFCDEIARNIMRMGFKINKAGDNSSQLMVMTSHLQNLLCNKNMVTDRCMIDGYAYSRFNYKWGGVDKWVNDFARKLTNEYISQYDCVFYLKPEFDIVNDGVRSTEVKWQQDMDKLFESSISEMSHGTFCKVAGSVEERVEIVIDKLNNL